MIPQQHQIADPWTGTPSYAEILDRYARGKYGTPDFAQMEDAEAELGRWLRLFVGDLGRTERALDEALALLGENEEEETA